MQPDRALRRLETLRARNRDLDSLIALLLPHDPQFVRRHLAPKARRYAAQLNRALLDFADRLEVHH